MPAFSGSCLCGSIQYKGDAEAAFTGNCYCTDCRKVSSTGHASLMAVPSAAIEMTGEIKEYVIIADSGATITHHFCPTCGAQMYNTNTNMAGLTVVVASTLDDPEIFKPQVSVYASRALSWDQPNADIPQFPQMPPMNG